MNFKDLYDRATANGVMPITFDSLRDIVNAHSQTIGRVDVFAIDYPVPNHQAYFKLGYDRTSAYDDEFQIAEIFFCKNLLSEERELRFALTKELMHIFDAPDELIANKADFEAFLKELQNKPIETSKAINSELTARWMTVIILCPREKRNELLEAYRAGSISDFDIAEMFEVPEWIVTSVMDDYYDIAWQVITGEAL